MQRGQIYRHNGSWLLRFWDVSASGRVRRAVKLAPIDKDYPTKRSVLLLAEKHLAPLNAGQVQPESALSVVKFIEDFYLPFVEKELRASTYKDYKKDIFEKHLKQRLGDVRLRDFRTVTGQRIIRDIASPTVGHKTLLRIKSFLSGAFKHALREGFLDGVNPIQNVSVPGRPEKFRGTIYTISQIEKIAEAIANTDDLKDLPKQDVLKIQARRMQAFAVISVAAFAGLRMSELRGLRWSDYDGETLQVNRSVWRTKVNEPKTESSRSSVPVLPILRKVLDDHQARVKGKDQDYMFAGERRGTPLNLANLVRRVIQPALDNAEDGPLKWLGWHSFRRGLASNLYAVGVAPAIIQRILRHSSVSTTMDFYVVTEDKEAREALQKIEDWLKIV
jgi:integrase